MDEALRRVGWICLLVIVGVYATFTLASNAFNQSSATTTPIVVCDILQQGAHHLSGKILVPSTSDELSVTRENVGNNEYRLNFVTWPEPSVKCINFPSERFFDTVIFAPSVGIYFSATLDRAAIPIAVYPTVSK